MIDTSNPDGISVGSVHGQCACDLLAARTELDRLRGISREAQRLEEDNDVLREEVHDFKAELVHVTVERDKLREALAVAHGTIDAFQTASGLCVPAEEQGGDPGGVQPRHVEEHVHALAKRVEELEAMVAAVGAGAMTEPLWNACVEISERRAGRAK